MYLSRTPILAALTLILAMTLAACGAQSTGGSTGTDSGDRTGQELDPAAVVAVVNGDEITAADLYRQLVAQNGHDALNRLITETLIRQEAVRAGVAISNQEVEDRLQNLVDEHGGAESFSMALMQSNLTQDQLKEDLRLNMMVERLMEPELDLSDEVIADFYAENQSLYSEAAQVHARHILVDTEAQAFDIMAQLDGGADFAELADAFSIDPSAADNGGDLGWMAYNQLVAPFADAAFNAAPGSRVGPVETEFGFHVIEVLDLREGRQQPLEEIHDLVRQAKLEQEMQEQVGPWLQNLYSEAEIEERLE
ncbi:MAG: peptidylprolyl isomerase [Thermaerobacterales bacterium]